MGQLRGGRLASAVVARGAAGHARGEQRAERGRQDEGGGDEHDDGCHRAGGAQAPGAAARCDQVRDRGLDGVGEFGGAGEERAIPRGDERGELVVPRHGALPSA
jgi:hypothetical protein